MPNYYAVAEWRGHFWREGAMNESTVGVLTSELVQKHYSIACAVSCMDTACLLAQAISFVWWAISMACTAASHLALHVSEAWEE